MCADEADEDDTGVEVYADDQAVGVTFDVKNDAVAGQGVGGAVVGFDVGEGIPVGVFGFMEPCLEGWLGIRVFLPEIFERFAGDDTHASRIHE